MRTLATIIGTIAGLAPAAAFAATTGTMEHTGLMGWIFLASAPWLSSAGSAGSVDDDRPCQGIGREGDETCCVGRGS